MLMWYHWKDSRPRFGDEVPKIATLHYNPRPIRIIITLIFSRVQAMIGFTRPMTSLTIATRIHTIESVSENIVVVVYCYG